MTAEWNTSGHAAAADVTPQSWGQEGPRLVAGIWSAATCFSDDDDPSIGAGVAWAAREVGLKWRDTGVDGTPSNPVYKEWALLVAAGPSYGWRFLDGRKIVRIADPTAGAVTFSPTSPRAADTSGFVDLDLSALIATLLAAYSETDEELVAEVLLEVTVTAGASETLTDATKGYISFKSKDATAANQDERVYAQVAARPNQVERLVELDVNHVCQFKVVVGGGTPSFAFTARILELRVRQ